MQSKGWNCLRRTLCVYLAIKCDARTNNPLQLAAKGYAENDIPWSPRGNSDEMSPADKFSQNTRIYQEFLAPVMSGLSAVSRPLCNEIDLRLFCAHARHVDTCVSDAWFIQCTVKTFASMAFKRAKLSMGIHHRIMQQICIWFCFKIGLTATETIPKMTTAFAQRTLKRRSIFHWHKQFKNGRKFPGDLARSGRPKTSRLPAAIQQVNTLIQGDCRMGIHRISKELSVSYGTVFTILHKDLQLKKKAAKFIPHVLTPAQRENRSDFALDFVDRFTGVFCRNLSWVVTFDEAWFHLHEPNTKMENMQWLPKGADRPQVAKRSKSARKVMMIPFFDRRGLVYCEFFENTTISQTNLMPLLVRFLHAIRIRRGVKVYNRRHKYLLHMDNALPHTALYVTSGINHLGLTILPHPPYSPDLSPCDFFLFPTLKCALRGKVFRNTQELKDNILEQMALIPAHAWEQCFDDWVQRCKKCYQLDGNYFEGRYVDLP